MHRIQRFLTHLAAHQWLEQRELKQWTVEEVRYITAGRYEVLQPRQASDLTLRATHGITYMLESDVHIPAEWKEHPAAILFSAGGGEGLLKLNGEFYHGLDRNHQFVPLRAEHIGQTVHAEIELYDPIPEPHDPLNGQPEFVAPLTGFTASLVSINAGLRSLMHSVRLLLDASRRLPEGELRRTDIEQALIQCMQAAYDLPQEAWKLEQPWVQLQQLLQEQVGKYAPDAAIDGRMIMVGQSHIDIAWLWPVRETVRKSSRTFSTMCTLLEQYPEFVYTQSQPQLFAYVKDHYPELYAKIKQYVAEGRWELVGGMWVEPDLNIPSGESLARQLLYGQRFYREEFGQTSSIEWLPDTFGYAASLPQLLRQAEIDYFMTTKLNWNDTNIFPYDLFQWVGIDGTPVLSYLNHGVNEHTTVKDIDEHWTSFRQKDIHPEQMLLYGHGDGGGGVTEEMVEYVQHAEWMIGQPKAEFGTAKEFFDHTLEKGDELPVWRGDLYLELHRGTYTTQAWNKRYNRKAEVLYREAEIWEQLAVLHMNRSSLAASEIPNDITDALADPAGGHAVPSITDAVEGDAAPSAADFSVSPLILDKADDHAPITAELFKAGWIGIMLNQFHDIVPGSAITEVYHTSDVEYEEILRIGEGALDQALAVWTDSLSLSGEGTPYAVFNSLAWERDEWVEIQGGDDLNHIAAYDEQGHPLAFDIIVNELAEPVTELPAAPQLHATAARSKLPGRVPYGEQKEESSTQQSATANADTDHSQHANHETVVNQDATPSLFTLRIHVPSIPAFGYRVIWLREAKAEQLPSTPVVPDYQPDDQQTYEQVDVHEYEHEDDVQSPADVVLGAQVPAIWETPHYIIRFNEQGEIISLYDREYKREVLQSGQAGNVFGYYHDRPTLWDAWDVDPHFDNQVAGKANLVSSRVVMKGRTGDILHFRWELGGSIITQDIHLYHHHRRIDFKTEVDWNESHKLLKVEFPVDLIAEQATYEIPFGALERTMNNNTSWDRAQFEVCGHRWADVSEGNYGVSLLNDCKYGYDIKHARIRLSLLRAPKWPDGEADIGQHEFTYSLLPHGGNWREAYTVRAAAELNQPAPVREVSYTPSTNDTIATQSQSQSQSQSDNGGVQSLLDYTGGHIVLDSIKPAEDDDGTIFRFYESSGSRGTATLRPGNWTTSEQNRSGQWVRTNLLEDEQEQLEAEDGIITISFTPYEIKTLKWKVGTTQ